MDACMVKVLDRQKTDECESLKEEEESTSTAVFKDPTKTFGRTHGDNLGPKVSAKNVFMNEKSEIGRRSDTVVDKTITDADETTDIEATSTAR